MGSIQDYENYVKYLTNAAYRSGIACGAAYAAWLVPAVILAATRTKWIHQGRRDAHAYRALLIGLISLILFCLTLLASNAIWYFAPEQQLPPYVSFGNPSGNAASTATISAAFAVGGVLYNIFWPTAELCLVGVLSRVSLGAVQASSGRSEGPLHVWFKRGAIAALVILFLLATADVVLSILDSYQVYDAFWHSQFIPYFPEVKIDETYNWVYLVFCTVLGVLVAVKGFSSSKDKTFVILILLSLMAACAKSLYQIIADLVNYETIIAYQNSDVPTLVPVSLNTAYNVLYPLCLSVSFWFLIYAGVRQRRCALQASAILGAEKWSDSRSNEVETYA